MFIKTRNCVLSSLILSAAMCLLPIVAFAQTQDQTIQGTPAQTPPAQTPPAEIPPPQTLKNEATDEDEGKPQDTIILPDAQPNTPLPKPLSKLNLPQNPSIIGNYQRHYEADLSEDEARYQAMIDQGLGSARARHPLEGSWYLSYSSREEAFALFEFRLVGKNKSRIDGAYRLLTSALNTGLLSDITDFDAGIEINFPQAGGFVSIISLSAVSTSQHVRNGTILAPDGTKRDIFLYRSRP